MSTGKKLKMFYIVFFGYIAVNFLIIATQMVLHETGLLSYLQTLIPFVVLNIIAIIGAFYMSWQATSPRVYRQAREHGLPIDARVLDIEATGWRTNRKSGLIGKYRPRRYEYRLQVYISRGDMPGYEATVFEFLVPEQVPKKGATIKVKIHPQQPEIVVMAIDDEPVT